MRVCVLAVSTLRTQISLTSLSSSSLLCALPEWSWAGGMAGPDSAGQVSKHQEEGRNKQVQTSPLHDRQTQMLKLPIFQFPTFSFTSSSPSAFPPTPPLLSLHPLEMSPSLQETNTLQTIYDAFLRKSDLSSIPRGPFFLLCSAAKRTF